MYPRRTPNAQGNYKPDGKTSLGMSTQKVTDDLYETYRVCPGTHLALIASYPCGPPVPGPIRYSFRLPRRLERVRHLALEAEYTHTKEEIETTSRQVDVPLSK